MKKHEAIQLLGGSVTKAAEAIGINSQAVTQWPEDLPRRISDRVIAALATKDPQRWPKTWKAISRSAQSAELAQQPQPAEAGNA